VTHEDHKHGKFIFPAAIYIGIAQACYYLSVNKAFFDEEVRPYLTEIRVGRKGVRFDLPELDQFADKFKERNGRLPRKEYGDEKWQRNPSQGSSSGAASGTYRKLSKESGASAEDFEKVLESVRSRRRKRSPTPAGRLTAIKRQRQRVPL
jgi:hypothetical protein